MKTATSLWFEFWDKGIEGWFEPEFTEWLAAIQADAREQGRREGLEEAREACAKQVRKVLGRDDCLGTIDLCVGAILELRDKSGSGDGK